MNDIIMIPIGQLHHHPENPRKDLGDLTELSESIKKNGVMQNLTVVLDPKKNGMIPLQYLVVIGNRRMEAAKMAGLEELPCVVSSMDHRAQIATMLEENMQRADLTVYEQAQGFQMMMDLGFTAAEISEKTGFSRTTVDRRLKMAELDGKTFQKAVGKQITMDVLDQLGKIEDVKKRNELLKDYGEPNFEWRLNRMLKVQQADKVRPKALQMLEAAKIKKVPEKDKPYTYSKYDQLYKYTLELEKWDGKRAFIPKADGELYWLENGTDIQFYVKHRKEKNGANQKTPEEIEEEKKIALAWKTIERSAETAAELRKAYADEIGVGPKNAMRMMQWALVAAFTAMGNYSTPTMTIKQELKPEGVYTPEILADLKRKIMDLPQSRWPALILMMFEGDWRGQKNKPPKWADGPKDRLPKHKINVPLELCYEWLTEFGYSMSTEEIEMMSGTHECFQEAMQV